MFKTKNNLPEEIRVQVIENLNERLADSLDLQYQVKQAHWNVKGRNFYGLHLLFDEVAEGVEKYVDEFAERITTLGGYANGTVRDAAKNSSLQEYPHGIIETLEHAEAVSTKLAEVGKKLRKGIDEMDEIGDVDTSDLYTEASRAIDKFTWLVEAHTQDEKKES
ncbi:MAG: DNA starvation/stationary phase protection protein Dps [Pyrinomonadaceae bacterium]|nr:DNA starvation/stationary phase protection protein Dps [Pyrinomonadaceae bacterium]